MRRGPDPRRSGSTTTKIPRRSGSGRAATARSQGFSTNGPIEETTGNLKQHPSTVRAICLMSLSHGRYNWHDGRRRLHDDPLAVPRRERNSSLMTMEGPRWVPRPTRPQQGGFIQPTLAASHLPGLFDFLAESWLRWAIPQTAEQIHHNSRRRTSSPPASAVEAETRCSLTSPSPKLTRTN